MPPKSTVFVAVPLSPSFLLPRSCLQSSTRAIPNQQIRSFGIKSVEEYKVSRWNKSANLLASPRAAYERKLKADVLPLRTGALAIKKGMTAIFDEETGKRIPCTVLQLERNQVIHHKTMKKHGYYAVCMGAGYVSPGKVTKPQLGRFAAADVAPSRYLQEFRVRDEKGLLPVGQSVTADWFVVGQYVDTRSESKGKGFQGVMKRWGFGGQPRTHGHSLSHRSLGSTGNGQGGGSRVYPGKKMPGRMGGERNTIQNVKVLQTDAENGIVLVHGAVSGPKGCVVMIQDALKKPWPTVPSPLETAETNQESREAVGSKTEVEA